jgi:DNA recombination protein RmuC
LGTVYEHWNKVGRNLGAAVQSYNQSIVSLESRALVSARKLKECAGITKELPVIDQLEQLVRE